MTYSGERTVICGTSWWRKIAPQNSISKSFSQGRLILRKRNPHQVERVEAICSYVQCMEEPPGSGARCAVYTLTYRRCNFINTKWKHLTYTSRRVMSVWVMRRTFAEKQISGPENGNPPSTFWFQCLASDYNISSGQPLVYRYSNLISSYTRIHSLWNTLYLSLSL